MNDADRIVSHLESAKPIAKKAKIYHIMTEWGGSYSNGAGTGAGVGHGVGGTANCKPLVPLSQRHLTETSATVCRQLQHAADLARRAAGHPRDRGLHPRRHRQEPAGRPRVRPEGGDIVLGHHRVS